MLRQSRRIIIDASHGGYDTGVVVDGVSEKNLALDISKYMYDKLKELGLSVDITRNSDITLSDDARINKILNTYGNLSDVILISNHIDSDEDNVQIIYALRNNNVLANMIEKELSAIGLKVKEPYQRRATSDTSKDYYSIHRNTGNVQPILIQYGNMSDYKNIGNNYKKYVDAVVRALVSYLGISDSDSNYYIVKSGDTLYSIARNYNLTVNDLKKFNNLSSNFLTIGQRLLISDGNDKVGETNSENIYIVKNGDTLYSISRIYNVSVDDLKSYNGLNSSLLNIGQIIRIPLAINDEKIDYIEYVVKRGDTLYNIALENGVSVSEIMDFNNLSTNLLSIGQILRIPILKDDTFIYVVKSGDNLYSIARKYDTTVDNIKLKNNLKSNLLNIGQKLII